MAVNIPTLMKKYILPLVALPRENFFFLRPCEIGKSTWLKYTYPEVIQIDLLLSGQERKYLTALEKLIELVDSL